MTIPPDGALASRALQRIGQSLCGRYRIRGLLGIGGMAAVYSAVHRNGHAVAIKILHDRLSADPEIDRLFRREALLSNKIGHPGVVPVTDDDVAEDGCVFLVMPLLDGETLRARAERLGSRLPLSEVLGIAHSILEALGRAHEKKIVHRDIKPENIFVTRDGQIRVLDFGIGRIFEAGDPASATRSGRAVGTPAFMAPEQALGRTRDLDGRTDLWAVGATVFTLLSGRIVHPADNGSETLVLAATRPAPRLVDVVPEIPSAVGEVVDRALSYDRDGRWPDAEAMAEALRAACRNALGCEVSALPHLMVPPSATKDEQAIQATSPPSFPGDFRAAVTRTQSPSPPSTSSLRGAVTRTLNLAAAGRSPPRWVAAVVAASLVAAGVVSVLLARSRAEPKAPGAPSITELDLLASARTAWLDGDAVGAREDAEKAAALAPADGHPHLAYVIATRFWPDEATREHFVRASALRHTLLPTEAAYLDAIAPGMTVPPDFVEAVKRLAPLLDAHQDDAVLRLGLSDMYFRIGDLDSTLRILAPAANAATPSGIALSRYAHVMALKDDVESARKYFGECLRSHPGSSVCAEPLALLEMHEGRCTDAERILRQQISISPDADAVLNLAYVLAGENQPADEVRPVLQQWTRLVPGPDRSRAEIRAAIYENLLRGRLTDALQGYEALRRSLEGNVDDAAQFGYTAGRMTLEAELGRMADASSTLSSYVAERNAFQRNVAGEDNTSYLQALGAEFAVLPWETWTAIRKARLDRETDLDRQLAGRPRSWLQHFAMPATSKPAADEALAELPRFGAILHRSDRWYHQDAAIARVYELTGHAEEAKRYFERAVRACDWLDEPVEYQRVRVHFAEFLVAHNDRNSACRLFVDVLRSWPVESGSVTSKRARDQLASLCRDSH